MGKIYSFEPIADKNSRILILGSMPGSASLVKAQYYGHERNGFWKVIYSLMEEDYEDDYERRKMLLLSHGIALWDVIKSCEREGSLDSDIRNPEVNDFKDFFREHPNIKKVFFNGQKAFAMFKKTARFQFEGISFTRLMSTSPANAVSFSKKLEDWKKVSEALKRLSKKIYERNQR